MLYEHKKHLKLLTKLIFDINYSVVIIEGVIINNIKHLRRIQLILKQMR